MSSKIILINGKKRAGKDFFAEKLQEELYKSQKTSAVMSFAKPIKQIIAATFGITEKELEDYKNDTENYGIEINSYPNNQPQVTIEYTNFRKILQNFGTEGMKPIFGDAIWARLLKEKAMESSVDYIIVPDFRFLIEDIGDVTVKIINEDFDNSSDTHASENELNDFKFDYTIDNTGYKNIDDQVQKFVQNLLG